MQFAAATSTGSKYFRWQVGGDTDIGGSKENQDDYFVWESKEKGIIVLCILDGHGRDVGKAAAEQGREALNAFFGEHHARLYTDPYQVLVEAFIDAHESIKRRFREKLEAAGWEVMEADEGYLLKRRPKSQSWFCVHGGTSCSIVAVVGEKVYTANVGDSSGLLCSVEDDLAEALITPVGDSAFPDRTLASHGATGSAPLTNVLDCALLITAEHSPESIDEFKRLHRFQADVHDPRHPALKIVYDAQLSDKHRCPQVFEIGSDGEPIVTNRGKYYKNVRREWASLVATPTSARFQDALAFTRSMGDLHLHIYGVTHLPEIHELDVAHAIRVQEQICADKLAANPNGPATRASDYSMVSIVLCSDGVWDNWRYPDVSKFVMDASCVNAVRQSADGATRVAESFMKRNAVYSKRNFGSQADNATGLVLYLATDPLFPEFT